MKKEQVKRIIFKYVFTYYNQVRILGKLIVD